MLGHSRLYSELGDRRDERQFIKQTKRVALVLVAMGLVCIGFYFI